MADFDFDRIVKEFLDGVSNAADNVSSAARDVSSDVVRYKHFAETGRDLFKTGLITSHGGNISETNGSSIWITCTGAMLGRLTPGAIVETTWAEGAQDANASIELVVHRALYQAFVGTNGVPANSAEAYPETKNCVAAIIHAHPAFTIARSLIDDAIYPLDSEGKLVLGEKVDVIRPAETIASAEAAQMAADLVTQGARVVVIAGHGPFAIAHTLEEALKLISCLERSAQIINLVGQDQTKVFLKACSS